MQQIQWEILILKPTNVFLSFLSSQLPDIDLPELAALQQDTTAYTIRKHSSEEATFAEIEKHFSYMFHHEICRWLGKDARDQMEDSLLDFLRCFKFEFHSKIVLMERSLDEGHQLICVKPRSIDVKWLKPLAATKFNDVTRVLEHANHSSLAENATVVVKNFKKSADVESFVQHYYRPIAKAQMLSTNKRVGQWPHVDSFQRFNHYFSIEFHTQLVHLH